MILAVEQMHFMLGGPCVDPIWTPELPIIVSALSRTFELSAPGLSAHIYLVPGLSSVCVLR